MWPWVLLVAVLALSALGIARLSRRTRDETVATVRSFDEYRDALNPDATALRSEAGALGKHLDRGPRSSRR